jgi:hypothetical protein
MTMTTAFLAFMLVASSTVTGTGETPGATVGNEILIVYRVFDGRDTSVHLRNVGAVSVSVDLMPACTQAARCAPARGLEVAPVPRRDDASHDKVVGYPNVALTELRWTARTLGSTAQATNTTRVPGHGETDHPVPVGSSRVKLFIQRDAHSTGIYIRNIGTKPVHVSLIPSCGHPELCPKLVDAVVPPVQNPHDGGNDYIYTANTLEKLTFDWIAWAP